MGIFIFLPNHSLRQCSSWFPFSIDVWFPPACDRFLRYSREVLTRIGQIPHRGKCRRGKVTKFWPGDENFPRRKNFHDEKFSPTNRGKSDESLPTKNFPRRIKEHKGH